MHQFKSEPIPRIHGLPVAHRLAEEIEQALERLRHVKRVQTAQLARRSDETAKKQGNRYVIPKRLVYKVSRSY